MIKLLLLSPGFRQLIKYAGISVLGYSTILLMMYLLVQVMGIKEQASFVLVYALAYISEYFINLKLLFKKQHEWLKVAKFIAHVIFFLGCGSFIFNFIVGLNVNYLIATLLTAFLLLPLRFLAHKFLVFS